MPESDARHEGDVTEGVQPGRRGGRRLRRTTAGAVALVLGAAGLAYAVDADDRLGIRVDVEQDPAQIGPPSGLELPEIRTAPAVAGPLRGVELEPREVRRAVRGLLDAERLGRRLTVAVADLDGEIAFSRGPARFTPASLTKILTAAAAVESLGSEHRFATSATLRGTRLTLVGGGDPLLARLPADEDQHPEVADLRSLARQTARALRERDVRRVRLRYDTGLFSGPAVNPRWEAGYVLDDVVTPIVPLWVDQGREGPDTFRRVEDPAGQAAGVFADELRRAGVTVRGAPRAGDEPDDAVEIASVFGAELAEVAQHVLEVSDNEGAEVLARHVAVAEGEPASFAGATRAVTAVLERLGVPVDGVVLHDGSGLARGNLLSAGTVIGALSTADDRGLDGVLTGLPVAGFSGSLSLRFAEDAGDGLGWVRAKTGTLTGVHGLAGTVVGVDGAVMLYVAVADRVAVEDTLFVRDRLDEISAALAACTCGR